MPKKLTQADFIKKVDKIHKNNLSFEHTIYKNSRSDISVNCKLHGKFKMNARGLLQGMGCKECNLRWHTYVQRQRMTTKEFVKKAKNKHEDFYSYEKSNYVNSRTKLIITCPMHGDFNQQAGGHLEGYGCQQCADLKHGDYRPWFIKTYFDRFPEKRNIPATLYLLYNKEENFYKVGITTKGNIEERIKYMSHYKFNIVDYGNDTMYNVAVAEQKILKSAEKYKPKKRFGGYSECIKKYIDIKKYVPKKVGKPYKGGNCGL